MPKYMNVYKDDEGTVWASFYSTYDAAESARMDAEVSLGYYCEMYAYGVDPYSDCDCPESYYPI